MRTKSHHIPSHEEAELAELAKIQPFKAKPVDHSILASNRPLLLPASRHLPTVPESPAITKPRPPPARPPSPERIVHARPVPRTVYQPPAEPQRERRPVTVPDFELPGDQISRKKRLEFEERQREEEEARKREREFHAQPLPFDDAPAHNRAPVLPRPVTQPQPFKLETDLRGMFSRLALDSRLEREQQELDALKEFKAQPIPHGHDEPFFPTASSRPLTEVDDVVLKSDVRAEERKLFDYKRKEKEKEDEILRQEMKREAELYEAECIRRLRNSQVHRALPPQYANMPPVNIHPSDRKLTDPESPFIGAKRRTSAQIVVGKGMSPAGVPAGGVGDPGGYDGEHFPYVGGGGAELQKRLYEAAEGLRLQKQIDGMGSGRAKQ
ncbi:Protein tpx2 [Thoreauomyces humboldtii]|nr:Protein tpx2 [Thoreauomyces humboldtii]